MMFSSCRTRSGSRLAGVALLILVVSLWISSERAHAQTEHCSSISARWGDASGTAIAVNASGHIVGDSETANGERHAFVWTPNGGMVDLGTLGGASSSPSAVNALGHVAGSSQTGNGDTHAFFWTPLTGMIDLGTLPGSSSSQATALNDSNQVVGANNQGSVVFPTRTHGFFWSPEGGMVDIGTLRGLPSSVPLAINARGQVVGHSAPSPPGFSVFAFSWTAMDGMTELGVLPGAQQSGASDVNDAGQVVGQSNFNNSAGEHFIHAFSWTAGGGMIDLGTVPSTRWSSEFSDSQFIQVDLGEDTLFDRIVLRWELARAVEYEIQVSSDGEDWSTLHRVAASGDVDDLPGFGSSARYIRMRGLRRATHWGYSLFEFEVYRDGINIAAGRPMTASSTERMLFPAAFAVDGDPSTRWISQFADEQWLAVDLGSTVTLDRVVLKWDASYAADYELLVSDDASSWRTIRTVTDADGGVDELTGLTARGRYVGLLLHRRGDTVGLFIVGVRSLRIADWNHAVAPC